MIGTPSSNWTEYKTNLTPITRQELYYDPVTKTAQIRYVRTSRLDTETKNHYTPARDFYSVKIIVSADKQEPKPMHITTYSKERVLELVDKLNSCGTMTVRQWPSFFSLYFDIPEVGYKSTEFADPYIMLAGFGIVAGLIGLLSVFGSK